MTLQPSLQIILVGPWCVIPKKPQHLLNPLSLPEVFRAHRVLKHECLFVKSRAGLEDDISRIPSWMTCAGLFASCWKSQGVRLELGDPSVFAEFGSSEVSPS